MGFIAPVLTLRACGPHGSDAAVGENTGLKLSLWLKPPKTIARNILLQTLVAIYGRKKCAKSFFL